MKIDVLKQQLCHSLCRDVSIVEYKGGAIVSLPMFDRDGDGFSIYLTEISGGWNLSDGASTLMRLSYENDVDSLLKGSKGDLFETYLAEAGATFDDGELLLDISADQLISSLFKFTQMMGRISDISLLKTSRVASTFYEDLRDALFKIIPNEKVHENYIVPNIPSAEDFKVDYMVEATRPLYIFGANSKDSVKLATITLQHLEKYADNFDSMVILDDDSKIPQTDIRRLMIAANDIVPSFTDTSTIEKKIKHRLSVVAS